jgi:hypothetical protein
MSEQTPTTGPRIDANREKLIYDGAYVQGFREGAKGKAELVEAARLALAHLDRLGAEDNGECPAVTALKAALKLAAPAE